MAKRKSGAIKVTCSAKKSAKASSCSISANKLNKQLMLVSVNYIAEQIVMEKKKNEGRVPWGIASKLLKEGQQTFPKMSMQMVNNYVKKIEEQQLDKRVGSSILVSNSTIAVSTITDDQPVPSINYNLHSAADNHSASSSSASSNSDDSETSTTTSNVSTSDEDSTINIGGHPKGTTASASHDLKCRIEVVTKESVVKLKELREKMKKEGA
jgi:hypothetical protein